MCRTSKARGDARCGGPLDSSGRLAFLRLSTRVGSRIARPSISLCVEASLSLSLALRRAAKPSLLARHPPGPCCMVLASPLGVPTRRSETCWAHGVVALWARSPDSVPACSLAPHLAQNQAKVEFPLCMWFCVCVFVCVCICVCRLLRPHLRLCARVHVLANACLRVRERASECVGMCLRASACACMCICA